MTWLLLSSRRFEARGQLEIWRRRDSSLDSPSVSMNRLLGETARVLLSQLGNKTGYRLGRL